MILNANRTESEELCTLLKARKYQVTQAHSFDDLGSLLGKTDYQALIIDLDSIQIDNRLIRRISRIIPGTPLLCISADRIHPGLEEAISNHIYACISKPVDPEEILYLLKCALENDTATSNNGDIQAANPDHEAD